MLVINQLLTTVGAPGLDCVTIIKSMTLGHEEAYFGTHFQYSVFYRNSIKFNDVQLHNIGVF